MIICNQLFNKIKNNDINNIWSKYRRNSRDWTLKLQVYIKMLNMHIKAY